MDSLVFNQCNFHILADTHIGKCLSIPDWLKFRCLKLYHKAASSLNNRDPRHCETTQLQHNRPKSLREQSDTIIEINFTE